MRLKNGEVCFGWPLAQHVITAGWLKVIIQPA